MTRTSTTTIEQLVTDLCEAYADAEPAVVRARVTTLVDDVGLAPAEAWAVIAPSFDATPGNVTTVDHLRSARMEPLEATVVGAVTVIAERPAAGAHALKIADGTGRLRAMLPADDIPLEWEGNVVWFRRLGIRKNTAERYAYARSRTEVIPVLKG